MTIVRETHETPELVAQRLAQAGGVNRYGEPNYRAVWGWNRLAWIGGKFEDRDKHGDLIREVVELRREPKYPTVNRWHIERWMPPESYGSPRQWYAQTVERENGVAIPALGPYPYRGDYEHCFTLQSPSGAFRAAHRCRRRTHRARHRIFAQSESRSREAQRNRSPSPRRAAVRPIRLRRPRRRRAGVSSATLRHRNVTVASPYFGVRRLDAALV